MQYHLASWKFLLTCLPSLPRRDLLLSFLSCACQCDDVRVQSLAEIQERLATSVQGRRPGQHPMREQTCLSEAGCHDLQEETKIATLFCTNAGLPNC